MNVKMARLSLAVVNLIAFLAVLAVNALSTIIPLGGMTPGQLSDLYPNLFVPAGLTFSIWGIIYLLLAVYVVRSLVFSVRGAEPSGTFMEKSAVLFLISCAANAGWIFSWQYRIVPLSLVCMVVLLVSLILIYTRLDIGRSGAKPSEKFLVHLPMSVYLGWISIATIANVTALLVYYKWQRFGLSEAFWAAVMIGIGIILGLALLFLRRDIFYALVVDWALLGIFLKQNPVGSPESRVAAVTAIIGVSLMSAGIIAQIARRRVYR